MKEMGQGFWCSCLIYPAMIKHPLIIVDGWQLPRTKFSPREYYWHICRQGCNWSGYPLHLSWTKRRGPCKPLKIYCPNTNDSLWLDLKKSCQLDTL